MAEELELFDNSQPHPGRILRRILEEKGWTQDELAEVTGKSRQAINELISGKVGLTPEMAVALGAAFGNAATEWMRIDSAYRLSITETDVSAVEQKARLYEIAPIREMQKRGWIAKTKNLSEIEASLKTFFSTDSLDKPIIFPVSAYRSETLGELNPAERAWCFRARQLSVAIPVKQDFNEGDDERLERELKGLLAFPQQAGRVSLVLSRFGIRLVVVEPIPGSRIDGAAFWLDSTSPVIAVTLRYDRMDKFWFTVMHEFSHVRNRDQPSIDLDLVADEPENAPILLTERSELRANEQAAAGLIPLDDLLSFIRRVGPLYSGTRIIQFAHRMRVHPSIIVGQLQRRREIKYTHHQQLFAKVRNTVIETALTDGWGKTITLGSA
jgi:HTH-type transcriptional regulator / antitoxin HigA